jgi:hypothetical protein
MVVVLVAVVDDVTDGSAVALLEVTADVAVVLVEVSDAVALVCTV